MDKHKLSVKNKSRVKNKRRAMAIIIVIFFSFILLILFSSLLFQGRGVAHKNKISLRQKQAYFAAKAAMQHLLLKARIFPTEFYDSIQFKQGKNPYFDFTEFPYRLSDGTPAFQELPIYAGTYQRVKPQREIDRSGRIKYFYIPIKKNGKEPEVLIRVASYYNAKYRYLDTGIAPSSFPGKYISPDNTKNQKYSPEKFVDYFVRDCSNDKVDGKVLQPSLVIEKANNIQTEQTWDINDTSGKYPYTMRYKVESIGIKTLSGLRRYNEEAVEIKCEGYVIDFQNKKATETLEIIEKITRNGH